MTPSPSPDLDAFADALARGQFGVALIDAQLTVARRDGPLSGWLPAAGAPACASPLLLHMEESFAALRSQGGEIVLPSMRLPAQGAARVTISIVWDMRTSAFVVVTTPDHGGDQIDRLLASERREKQLLQQQADASAARLRVADALYRDIVESSGDLVLRFGADRNILFANRQAARVLGLPQDALVGRAVETLFPVSGDRPPWRLAAAADGPVSFEMAARDAAGRAVWLWWDMRFLGAAAGGEFQAVARDVTAARLLRAAREKAQEEARDAAIANERLRIAHDLHDTLVRSIVTLIAQMRIVARTTTDENAGRALQDLDAQARDGLREARAAITHMREARREENNLRAIVDAFAARMRENAIDIDAQFNVDSRELSRETEELFARVLREALRNVELHSGAQRLVVALHREGDALRLTVRDDGVGFDPSAPTPGHYGVAGMHERARLMGATLEVVSAAGAGTTVTLTAAIGKGAGVNP